jgi:DNA-binding response OmpR family regulator
MTGEQYSDVGAEEAKRIGRIWQQGPRILILAEDAVLGESLLEEFQEKGCAVALATRGRDGLRLLRSGLVDLVVSEMALPDLPGMDLLQEVRTLTRRPKVILTTRHHSDYLASRAIENGASAVLCKPIDIAQVLALVARVLGN